MDDSDEDDAAYEERCDFFRNLYGALWNEDEDDNSTFAGGRYITPDEEGSSLDLQSVHVEGVGELRLPLSTDDFVKLLGACEQAPYGRGQATVINPDVRRAWQVDASKVTFPQCPDFVSNAVRLFANEAVDELGLDGAALQLEAHLYKLLLYEADGHFSAHRDTEKEPGMFATLVLQLPTEGGFEGGALHVRHGGITKTFDFSSDSTRKLAYTVFYADCEHVLERITNGKRLCLAFNLVRRNVGFGMQPRELQRFSSRLALVEEALLPWKEAVTREAPDRRGDVFTSDKLAIALQHKYTKKNLSFSGLKGEDRMAAHVLTNCRDAAGNPWLDVHLCILTLYKSGPAGPVEFYKRRRRYLDSEGGEVDDRLDGCHKIEDVSENSVTSSDWVDISNRRYNLELKIDPDTEVVYDDDQDGPFDEEGRGPDLVRYEMYMGNYGPTMDYEYHTAVLVIWPKEKLISMACMGGMPGALDILEARAAAGDPVIVTMLREVLSYCESNAGKIWYDKLVSYREDDLVSARLLKLCLMVGKLEDTVRVLELLSKPHTYEFPSYMSNLNESRDFVIGVRGVATASAIACVVERHGWTSCEVFIMEMLKEDRVVDYGKYFAALALELQKLGCESAALLVAKQSLELTYFTCSNLSVLKGEMVVNLGKMIFCIKECMDKVGLGFVERLGELKTGLLCTLVVQIHSEAFPIFRKSLSCSDLSGEDNQQALSTQAVLFKRICQLVTTRDFHRPDVSQAYVVNLIRTFFQFGDEQLFDTLIQAVLHQSKVHKEQHLLKELLDSEEIWKDLSGTVMGRSRLQQLCEERILGLTQPDPPFTWCMPSATFSEDRTIKAFLRGPDESLRYTDINMEMSVPYANNFAKKYFDGRYVNGYSAVAEVVKQRPESSEEESEDPEEGFHFFKPRPEVCIVIKKTRTAFECDLARRKREQLTELSRLRDQLGKINSETVIAGNLLASASERVEGFVTHEVPAM